MAESDLTGLGKLLNNGAALVYVNGFNFCVGIGAGTLGRVSPSCKYLLKSSLIL